MVEGERDNMKEKDYINATNLAKLRIAYSVLGDVQIDDPEYRPIIIAVDKLIHKVEKLVSR